MANRDNDDDRRWDRGSRDDRHPDDGFDSSGRGSRQLSQSDDRYQGGYQGGSQAGRGWQDRSRGDWDERSSGRDQWAGARDFSRGGMSQSGGTYGQSYGQSHSRPDQGRGYGSDYRRPDYGHGSQAQDDWGTSSRGYGYGSRQSQGDMGLGRDLGFGESRGWGGSAGREGYGHDYGAQGSTSRNTWAQDDGRFGRAEEDRWNRSRGSMGGMLGSGDRDYRDYRGDRDRSLLGEIANALGFGSDRHRDDRDRTGAWSSDQARRGGMGPKGYTRSDSRIEEDVNEKLSAGHLDASDVEVKVKEGEVTLSGTVRSRADKRRAEDIADDCSGVKHVQNNIRVQDNWSQQGSQGNWSAGGQEYGALQTGSAASTGAGQIGSQQGSQQGKSEPNKF